MMEQPRKLTQEEINEWKKLKIFEDTGWLSFKVMEKGRLN